jgi:2-dehydropantoate 2-reductase
MAAKNSEAILIVGTGALACLFAARLRAAGSQVAMLGSWPDGLRTLRENGVSLVDADGHAHNYDVHASADPADFAGSQRAIVLVKAWQTARVATQLFESLSVDGVALTLQNGLGNREQLIDKLGPERVAYGVITTGATLLGPGQVRWAGEGAISLGEHPRLGDLPDLLQGSGFRVATVPDVNSVAWSKLVINAAINPLTAVMNIPNGDLSSKPALRELSAALAHEVAAVAAAQSIPLTFTDPAAAALDVATRTAANLSSMLQDVRRGALTEIDAICGAVVRAGKAAGVATPLNDAMLKLVTAMRPQ